MNLTSKRMLQFMTVCAGACALSATATTTWVTDSFEAAPGQGYTNGVVDMPIGTYKMWVSGDMLTTNAVWLAAPGDASTLKTGAAADSGYAGIHPIVGANQSLVLNLSTEGQTLSRSVTNSVDTTCSFASTEVYVDTLIKFTPSEDTPTIAGSTKVAVYVNANSNLVVYHKADVGGYVNTNSVFPSLGIINPTNWYRLTIKMGNPAIGNPACKIYMNGMVLTNALTLTDVGDPGGEWFMTVDTGVTLSAVAFQGTGAVDELVVTDVPADFGTSGTYLTLMFTSAQVEVRTNGVAVGSGAVVKDGAGLVITAKPWYEITDRGALFTGGDTTNMVSGTTMITNINGTVSGSNGQTNTIVSGAYSQSGSTSTGLGGSYPANKVAAWALDPAKGNGVTTLTPDMLDEYLLNTAINANPGLKISSIVYDAATPKSTITVVATNGTGVVNFQAINGTMNVAVATNLVTGFGSPTPYSITVTNTTGMTIDVPGAAGNFLKAVVQ